MRSKIKRKLYWSYVWSVAFHSLFWLLSKCFYQLSQMKTNWRIIPSPISKRIRTFLDWVMTFHLQDLFTRNPSITWAVIFLLFTKITQRFCHAKVVPKKTHFLHLYLFSAQPFGTGSLQTFSFFSHIFHLFQYKSELRMWKFQNIIATAVFESLMS